MRNQLINKDAILEDTNDFYDTDLPLNKLFDDSVAGNVDFVFSKVSCDSNPIVADDQFCAAKPVVQQN